MTVSRPIGAVAAGHRLTAETAAKVLRDGGNAADAAIAALAMACVCEPVLASPGGGGFAMVRDANTGQTTLIDFFPHTPRQKRQKGDGGVYEIIADFGGATQAFHIGPATVATPGFQAGIGMLSARAGSAALADLFAPAIKAARAGITVSRYQHYLATVVKPILTATPHAARLFAPDGDVTAPGGTFVNPGLADALELLATSGFARSQLGSALAAMQQASGHLTQDDLDRYTATERAPHVIELGEARVLLNPLPAASGILIGHSLDHLGETSAAGFAHALAQTDQARRECGNDLGALISTPLRQRGTTHVSVIDGEGNAVAVTVSNGEGNGEIVGDFGFMPNNILGEEDVNPHGPAGWPIDTRLASMMCPAIIEGADGAITALGSGGSNRIRSAMFQVIARLCRGGEALEQSIRAPRIHVENGQLDFEDLFETADASALRAFSADHRAWREPNMFFGGVHAVAMTADGKFAGAGDDRREGVSIIVT